MSAPFSAQLDPPGDAIKGWDPGHRTAAQPHADRLPQTFLDAMSVREDVFVDEQKCSWENEVDEDDPRSFHFVVYASVSSSSSTPSTGTDSNTGSRTPDNRKPSGHSLPVGTIRLVPPPHPPHPLPAAPVDSNGDPCAANPKYHEPYLKLTRLAVLAPYRHLRLGKLLVNTALDFARRHPTEVRGRLDPAAVEALRTQALDVDGETVIHGAPVQVDNIPGEVKGALDVDHNQQLVKGEEVKRVVDEATGEWRGLVLVHAQVSALSFWEKMGFEIDEGLGEWDEEGIKHVGVWKWLDVKGKTA